MPPPNSSPPLQLALFDLDHTLLPIDSDVSWANELARLGLVDPQQLLLMGRWNQMVWGHRLEQLGLHLQLA